VDADAAVRAAYDHGDRPTVAIIKHANPCGIAVGENSAAAYAAAHACDPVSAYGGVVATNARVTLAMAHALNETFSEVVVAPAFDDDALAALGEKKNRRVIRLPEDSLVPRRGSSADFGGLPAKRRWRDAVVESDGVESRRMRMAVAGRPAEQVSDDLQSPGAARCLRAMASVGIGWARSTVRFVLSGRAPEHLRRGLAASDAFFRC
jgi:phosphoribosylaminoimidazolecarboxamide formyltransferase/IMP cyclohydrolase